MSENIREIELRRLGELERTAAQFGPRTDPAVLIEIQDIYHKHSKNRSKTRFENKSDLDYDFLMNTVAAALVRLTNVEIALRADKKSRIWRQRIHDFWMVAISVLVVVTLVVLLIGR